MADEKTNLRQRFKRDRITLTETERKVAESQMCDFVTALCRDRLRSESGTGERIVAMYAPIRGEADVTPVCHLLLQQGWQLAFPRVWNRSQMSFHTVDNLDRLLPGAFGILEPPLDSPIVQAKQIDMALIPGLAFTPEGVRLGYGGGFYDRFLPGLSKTSVVVGIAFAKQIVPELPEDAHDMRVEFVVTEQGVIDCLSQRDSLS